METRVRCYHCGTEVLRDEKIFRGDECPSCGRALRVCKNCVHYDKGKHNDCRETQAERVVDKERETFCDYFTPTAKERDGARESGAERLFGDAPTTSKKKTLDDLFSS